MAVAKEPVALQNGGSDCMNKGNVRAQVSRLVIHTPRENSREPCGLSLDHLKKLAGDGNRAPAFDAGYALSPSPNGALNVAPESFVRRGTVRH